MRSFFINFKLILVIVNVVSLNTLVAQSLLFRIPYANMENPLFNQAFSGNDGPFRAQYLIGKTGLPANDIHALSADGQIYRFKRSHQSSTGYRRDYKPELFITGGISVMNYHVDDQYSFREFTPAIGFRVSIPNRRDRTESIGAGHVYQAIKQTSSNFLAINLFSTNVSANLFEKTFSFNNDISFNLNSNNFDVNRGIIINQENLWVNGISGLFFLSIIPPREDKPDRKPVLYTQLGYRDTFNNPEGLIIDYPKLRSANFDVHFKWPFGNPDRIQNSLSMTVSYIRINQSNDNDFGKFFNDVAFSQHRIVSILHFQNEKPLGFDTGIEYTVKQHYAVFVNVKYRSDFGFINVLLSGGIPTDKFDDITLRGDNSRRNFQLGLSYSTLRYKRNGQKIKNSSRAKNSQGDKN